MEIRSNRALCLFTVTFFLRGHQTWQFEEDGDGDLTRTRRGEPNFPGLCPDGWYTFGEMCYKIGTRTRPWESALRDCTHMESHLVSIHNQAEQDFLNVLVMEIRSNVWIGLKRNPELFEWEDSSPLHYKNWVEGEPNNWGHSEENCAEMRQEQFPIGKWNDVSCNLNKYYICKKPKDPNLLEPGKDAAMCPNEKGLWFKMRDSCYKIFHRPDSFLSWSQAQSLCQSYGGNLAYIKNTAINKLLEINTKGMQGPFWTGVRSQMHQYTWLGKGYPLIYSNWQTDLPNEMPNGENCVAMDAEGEWIIRDCEESHPFICETGPAPPVVEPFGVNLTCSNSSQKWYDIGGEYCYIFEIFANLNWDEASRRCSEEGGLLASLHSDVQRRIIMNYIKFHDMPLPPVYIGLFMDQKGSYRWSDGTTFEFSNWDYGEPNNSGGTQICGVIQMTNGRWKDVFCSETFGFICSTLKIPQRENLIPKTEKLVPQRENLIPKTEKLSPETEAPKPAGEEARQLSAGGIAMIVVSCLLVLAAVSVGSLYYFGNSLKAKVFRKSTYSGIK